MKKIDVQKISPEDRMTREGGEKLRKMILDSSLPLVLEFHSKAIASVSFLDEGIAKLILEGWSKEKIETHLKLSHIHPRDLSLIQDLIQARLKGES